MKKIKYKSYILKINFKVFRLDCLLVILLNKYSRSFIKKLISNNFILIDGNFIQKPNYKFIGLHHLDVYFPYSFFSSNLYGEPINLNIIYEDNDIIIIDKKKNIVVHPSVNYKNGTLLNGLIYYYPSNYVLYRAGIVHRLDKNASGLIIVAKTQKMQFYLINLFKNHKIVREYQVIVYGIISQKEGIINVPLGVHKKHPMQRSVRLDNKGKPAKTKFIVQETFSNFSRLLVKLYTGRTHQIRVHMAYIQHPVIGDFIYGKKINTKLFKTQLKHLDFNRLALQATKLGFFHITYKKYMEWKLNLSNDIYKLINFIKNSKH